MTRAWRRAAVAACALAAVLGNSLAVRAQDDDPPARAAATPAPLPIPKAHTVTTHHVARIGGKNIAYDATAGTILLYDAKNHATASVFYHAYVASGLGAKGRRPVTFSYNGGPGAPSNWVDIAAFGPRILRVPVPEHMPPPPYQMQDNGDSVLDRTDLVFIDAVGTGYSKLVGTGTGKEYYGIDEDGKAFAQFVRRYVTQNDRWNSPKYLIGESYGTTRSCVLANDLENAGIAVTGITLVSSVLDFETLWGNLGNDEPYMDFFPTEAAVATYYRKVAAPAGVDAFLRDARAFAAGPYASALIAGDTLGATERAQIAQKMSSFIGLPVDYILRSNLRVPPYRFQKVLLGDTEETVGRYDARFRGPDLDPIGADADTDPSDDAIDAALTAAFNSYVRDELNYKTDDEYVAGSGDVNGHWNWSRGGRSSPAGGEVLTDLASAMTTDRYLHVLSVNGIYDMATPFFATEQSLHHLGIAPELQKNIAFRYYPSGHAIYLNPVAHASLHDDIEAFYAETSR